jgi:cytochrome d ubiquinol oxidase subunit I
MNSALGVDRLQFAFTITFHYIFPPLTIGLALLIVVLKTLALWKRDESYNRAARFWARIFAINFAMGVVTGIPLEFQFGTNWAAFSRTAGGVIGQTLAMEGVFTFFLESSFLGLFLYGEKRLGPKLHWASAFLVFLGSWLSGFFIIATNAWMQHPVGYTTGSNGRIALDRFTCLVLDPWLFWQYWHNMIAAVVTASFVMAGLGAFYVLAKKSADYGAIFVRVGVIAGVASTLLMIFPRGTLGAKWRFCLCRCAGNQNCETRTATTSVRGQWWLGTNNRNLPASLVIQEMAGSVRHSARDQGSHQGEPS